MSREILRKNSSKDGRIIKFKTGEIRVWDFSRQFEGHTEDLLEVQQGKNWTLADLVLLWMFNETSG